jgi:hypothetical protein
MIDFNCFPRCKESEYREEDGRFKGLFICLLDSCFYLPLSLHVTFLSNHIFNAAEVVKFLLYERISQQCKNCVFVAYSCQSCDQTCLTCVGPSTDDCLQCADGLWYEDSMCVTDCSDGHFATTINEEKFCQL